MKRREACLANRQASLFACVYILNRSSGRYKKIILSAFTITTFVYDNYILYMTGQAE
ncbi:MAG: hypothetical protein LUF04_12980 [Bacteroides sp.]|nr:hypothetical protein [Bacteroides sp.]